VIDERDHRLPADAQCLFEPEQIAQALDELAARLNRHFAGQRVVALCVMNGGLIFSGHLLPKLQFDIRVDYCHATRYQDSTSGTTLKWIAEPWQAIAEQNILILDDILDEGNTLKSIVEYCREKQAADVVSAVLLDKHHDRRIENVQADYAALCVEDRYVFGFGMDYEGAYRNLDAIYALAE
jgi:hypoxanthine phosphoribosyltransferase